MSVSLPDAKTILDEVDAQELLSKLKLAYEKTSTTCVLKCPLGTHADENPSFLFYTDSKRFECRACGEKGDAIELTIRALDCKRFEAVLWLAKEFKVKIAPNISSVEIYKWQENLKTATKYERILARKGITRETADKFKLGFDGERITIPIEDASGTFINVRRYNPFSTKSDDKYLNLKGAFSTKNLFPISQVRSKKLIFAEGEFKALALIQRGFNAITSSGGATHWNNEWNGYFKGVDVYFVYDVDRAGRRNANAHAKRLYPFVNRVYLVELPIDPIEFPHGDVCDYFGVMGKTAEDFQKVLDAAKPWQPNQVRDQDLDPEVYPTSLSAASMAKFQRKKIQVDGIISAKDTAPFVVPSKIGVFCDREDDLCVVCPIATQEPNGEKGSTEVEVDIESDRVLHMVGVKTKELADAMKAACGIPMKCKSCLCRAIKTTNVEDVRIIPQIAIGTKDSEHVVQNAFYVGHGIETNASYRFRMRMYASPQTQHVVGLITDAEPNADNIGAFQLTDELRAELRIFQPDEWTVGGVVASLDRLYADLEANVTRIYARRDLHMFLDLIYHSALRLSFDGVSIKGWMEGLVIGDSGQGKSECANRLRDHVRLGEKVGDKSATSAGLIGGLEENGKRWMIKWGTIPLNDRGHVTIEEAKGIREETIAMLTDMRSSGIAEINKIEKRRTNARTRLTWISNPRSQRKLATYNHGVDAVKELMGSLEDVRRFDMAMCVASGQVSIDTINRTKAECPTVEHRFTSDRCNKSVLFAWSRQEKDVYFENEAVAEILREAKNFGREYSSGIPLVEPADQRLKLARISAALAIRTFCVDHTGRVAVKKCHVEVVCAFLRRIYDDPVMGYKKFSEKVISEECLVDEPEVRDAIFRSRFAKDMVRNLMGVNSFDAVSLMNFGDFDRDQAQSVLSTLTRKNAVLPYKRLFIKTPAFAVFLKKMLESPELAAHEKHMAGLMKKPVETEIR